MTSQEYIDILRHNLEEILSTGVKMSESELKEQVISAWDSGENALGEVFWGTDIDNGGPFDGMRYRTLNITGALRDGIEWNGEELVSTAGHFRSVQRDIESQRDIDIMAFEPSKTETITDNIRRLVYGA